MRWKTGFRALNPGVNFHPSALARMPLPSQLAKADIYDPATKGAEVSSWLNAAAYAHDHAGRHDVNRHSDEIGSFLSRIRPAGWSGNTSPTGSMRWSSRTAKIC